MILLDTNVISELMKKPADPNVLNWYIANEAQTILPATALGEIAFGLSKLPFGKRRTKLQADFSELRMRYFDRVRSFAVSSVMIYGDIMAEALTAKHNMSVADGQIAAIAIEYDCILATRNIKDFKHVSVKTINPWDA